MATKAKKVVKVEEGQFKGGVEFPELPRASDEKQRLLVLYKTLQDLGVRSISDLENLIAKAE